MKITLDRTSATPYWVQVSEQIRRGVHTGDLSAGTRLASARHMAIDLGVGFKTVARAYKALEAEGLVVTRAGAGTRVAESPTVSDKITDLVLDLIDCCVTSFISREQVSSLLEANWPDPRRG